MRNSTQFNKKAEQANQPTSYNYVNPYSAFNENEKPINLGTAKDMGLNAMMVPMFLGFNSQGKPQPGEMELRAIQGQREFRDTMRNLGLASIPKEEMVNYTPWNRAKGIGGKILPSYFMGSWLLGKPNEFAYNMKTLGNSKLPASQRATALGEEVLSDYALATELAKMATNAGMFSRWAPAVQGAAYYNPLLFGGMAALGLGHMAADHIQDQTGRWDYFKKLSDRNENASIARSYGTPPAKERTITRAPLAESLNDEARGDVQSLENNIMGRGPGVILDPESMAQIREGKLPPKYKEVETPTVLDTINPAAKGMASPIGPQQKTQTKSTEDTGVWGMIPDFFNPQKNSDYFHQSWNPQLDLDLVYGPANRNFGDPNLYNTYKDRYWKGTLPNKLVEQKVKDYYDYLNTTYPVGYVENETPLQNDGIDSPITYTAALRPENTGYVINNPDTDLSKQLKEAPVTKEQEMRAAEIRQLNAARNNPWNLFGWLGNQIFRPKNETPVQDKKPQASGRINDFATMFPY